MDGAPGEFTCVVIEGDTNEERELGGGCVLRHLRTFSAWRGDRFYPVDSGPAVRSWLRRGARHDSHGYPLNRT